MVHVAIHDSFWREYGFVLDVIVGSEQDGPSWIEIRSGNSEEMILIHQMPFGGIRTGSSGGMHRITTESE